MPGSLQPPLCALASPAPCPPSALASVIQGQPLYTPQPQLQSTVLYSSVVDWTLLYSSVVDCTLLYSTYFYWTVLYRTLLNCTGSPLLHVLYKKAAYPTVKCLMLTQLHNPRVPPFWSTDLGGRRWLG